MTEDPSTRATGASALLRARSLPLKAFTILAPGAVAVVVLLFLPRIPQDPLYHHFADQRIIWDIPRFGDVVTNMGFVWVGLLGLWFMSRKARAGARGPFREPVERIAYIVFFLGLLLTGLGSTWYHLAPDSGRLVWDRLPMTLAFMSLLSIVVSERASISVGTRSLLPLLLVGAGSVIYWHLGERVGNGDLRFYGLVQFYPMLAIPLLLILFRPRYTHGGYFWRVIVWYALAKACEVLDQSIFDLNGIVSGHNLKHVLAAIGAWHVLRMLERRQALCPVPRQSG